MSDALFKVITKLYFLQKCVLGLKAFFLCWLRIDLLHIRPVHLVFSSVLSGPAAFCQCSQCSVPFTLSTKRAEQSGARSAALEEAGPGTEEVCVRPPCCSQLNCPVSYWWNKKKKKRIWKIFTVIESLIYITSFFLICSLYRQSVWTWWISWQMLNQRGKFYRRLPWIQFGTVLKFKSRLKCQGTRECNETMETKTCEIKK